MDWLSKIKDKITPRREVPEAGFQSAERRSARLPAQIRALCSVRNDAAFSVLITDLGVTGVRVDSPRRIEPECTVDLKVPVGLNFENRDTQMYVSFEGLVMWCRRKERGNGYEAGIQYAQVENEQRDRWLALVLEAYGFNMDEKMRRGEIRCRAQFPVTITRPDGGEVLGTVVNLSLGGMLAVHGGAELPVEKPIPLRLGPVFDSAVIEVTGHVVRSKSEHMDDTWLVGVAFDEVPQKQRDLIVRTLATLGPS